MDILNFVKAAKCCERDNIFQKYHAQVLKTLLKYTYSDEDVCPSDLGYEEIDYLVQVKGLTPYQATIVESWISAKCEFEYDSKYESEIAQVEDICDKLKRGIDTEEFDCGEHGGLMNLLVTFHKGQTQVNREYEPFPDRIWFTYYHDDYTPPRPMQSLFDMTKDVVVTSINSNVVKEMLLP